jgi:hypothetical protein
MTRIGSPPRIIGKMAVVAPVRCRPVCENFRAALALVATQASQCAEEIGESGP